jgi:hypothetical protein
LNQEYLSVKDNLRKTWNNWLRLKKRRSVQDMLSAENQSEE